MRAGVVGSAGRKRGDRPREVPWLADAVDLRLSDHLACATGRSGKLSCWDGTPKFPSEAENLAWRPEVVEGLGPARMADSMRGVRLVVLASGRVVLWKEPRSW